LREKKFGIDVRHFQGRNGRQPHFREYVRFCQILSRTVTCLREEGFLRLGGCAKVFSRTQHQLHPPDITTLSVGQTALEENRPPTPADHIGVLELTGSMKPGDRITGSTTDPQELTGQAIRVR
jgi:hypothetical protein